MMVLKSLRVFGNIVVTFEIVDSCPVHEHLAACLQLPYTSYSIQKNIRIVFQNFSISST